MNRRRILLILVRLLAFLTIAQAAAIWIFCRSPWTPIERHYLSSYIWSSLPLVGPSTVEVRLIWKTGRHRNQQLATDNDAIDSDDGTSMVLSRSASAAGWKALVESPAQQVPAELLSQDLAALAFEGRSLWDLFLLPELSALVALCSALGTWYLLIGFFRALPAELAWRWRHFGLEELFSSFFDGSAALARRAYSGLKPLRGSAVRRLETHFAAPSTKITEIATEAKRASFALPLFGVYNETGEGYLWTERMRSNERKTVARCTSNAHYLETPISQSGA